MAKILIFGIGGFVGSYLTQEFLDAGYTVYGTDLKRPRLLQDTVPFFEADITNQKEVLKVITQIKPEMIVNLAGISSVGYSWNNPQTTVVVNVLGTINILEAVRSSNNNPKIMFIGSSEEYEANEGPITEKNRLNANNPYGISKITQGNFISLYREQYGIKVYEVRPFNHTGVGQKETFVLPSFCKQIAEIEKSNSNGVIEVGNISIRRDFSHVKDIVRAYRLIIENENFNTIYNVGSGVAYELEELLSFIIGMSSRKITVKKNLDRIRVVDTPVIQADTSLIKKELGWQPNYTVFNALREMYEYYLDEK
ncbi:GDP-mannose 4,6-dehydratase [Enterococcus sp. AZ109]|uniref:GDP-mannose 4,6-dehydratase n=1 Tax=Enterococcus sp. AZ109 TaxID=2774634 RepID=UPI003F23AE01